MTAPEPGITIPVHVEHVTDGDTVKIRAKLKGLLGLFVFKIRLIDCWAPETNRPVQRDAGIASKHYLEELVEKGKVFKLTVPFSEEEDLVGHLTNMGRVLAWLDIDGEDVSELMVKAGMATREKQK